jgi:hypothetical protein
MTQRLLEELAQYPPGTWVAVRRGVVLAHAPTRSALHALVPAARCDFELKVPEPDLPVH